MHSKLSNALCSWWTNVSVLCWLLEDRKQKLVSKVAQKMGSKAAAIKTLRPLYCNSYVSMTFIMFCVLQTAGEGHQWDSVDIPPVVPEGCFQSGVSEWDCVWSHLLIH